MVLVSVVSLTACLDLAGTEDSESTGGGAGASNIEHDSGWGLEPLPCDPAFELSETPVVSGKAFTVWFTDDEPLTNLNLLITPDGTSGNWAGPKDTCTTCVWHWDVTEHPDGVLTLAVTATEMPKAKTCQVHSAAPGTDAGSE